ncbi:SAVMC3_10250 family protein [Streptomyces sp. JL3001]|uniref:SAVMC3_10250 family protein n=1 Tax=Streptomyces sp. JL3001 TaxID=3400923 RepID=UPI003B27E7F8
MRKYQVGATAAVQQSTWRWTVVALPAPAHENPAADGWYAALEDAGAMIFTEDGYLSLLEIYSASSKPITAWPDLRFVKRCQAVGGRTATRISDADTVQCAQGGSVRFNELIYFSRRRLDAFFPARAPLPTPSWSIEVDLQVATVGLGTGAPSTPTDAERQRLRKVQHHLETEASHFYAPHLATGQWIYFDLEMGWGTSHEDGDLPDLDDVVLFCGSLPGDRSGGATTVDLMLCGSTEHLLQRTATAGRMGSGSTWLHQLIRKVNESDRAGLTGVPEELTERALAVPRINRPEQIARDVFRIAQLHHAPYQRSRVQGLARVDLNLPSGEWTSSLVMATPLFVQYASRTPLRWLTRLRLHRDLCRRYGRPLWKWRRDLPPCDRNRYFEPVSAQSQ